jgi:hypothetical protein
MDDSTTVRQGTYFAIGITAIVLTLGVCAYIFF